MNVEQSPDTKRGRIVVQGDPRQPFAIVDRDGTRLVQYDGFLSDRSRDLAPASLQRIAAMLLHWQRFVWSAPDGAPTESVLAWALAWTRLRRSEPYERLFRSAVEDYHRHGNPRQRAARAQATALSVLAASAGLRRSEAAGITVPQHDPATLGRSIGHSAFGTTPRYANPPHTDSVDPAEDLVRQHPGTRRRDQDHDDPR